jgi:hypothetical protein
MLKDRVWARAEREAVLAFWGTSLPLQDILDSSKRVFGVSVQVKGRREARRPELQIQVA